MDAAAASLPSGTDASAGAVSSPAPIGGDPPSATEELLSLSNGRRLAFDHSGDFRSLVVVLFYHGIFGVGKADSRSRVLVEKRVHFIAPTLPGWGRSSLPAAATSYTDTLTADFTALIHHLYPDPSGSVHPQLQLFISGGSFGTIAAQTIYGQPLDNFPLGRQIRGLMLLSPFSKPLLDPNFNKSLTMGNWFMIGSPSYYLPWLPRLLSSAIKPKFATIDSAEASIRATLFDHMGEQERRDFSAYQLRWGLKDGQLEREFATSAWRSVQQGMEGFTALNRVMYEDWGFHPRDVDGVGRRVLIYAARGDTIAPNAQAVWLSENYRNAELHMLDGGHIVALTSLEEIWTAVLKDIQ